MKKKSRKKSPLIKIVKKREPKKTVVVKEKKVKPLTIAQQARLIKKEARERKKQDKLDKKAERELKKKQREDKKLAKLNAEPKVRVRIDIEFAERSYEDLYDQGYCRRRENDKWDMSSIKNSYFSSLPEHLIVTPETEVNKFLWCALDFVKQRKKEVLILKEHRIPDPANPRGYLVAIDGANRQKIFFYDQVCIMPQNYREKVVKHVQAVNRLTDKKARKNVNVQAVLDKEDEESLFE